MQKVWGKLRKDAKRVETEMAQKQNAQQNKPQKENPNVSNRKINCLKAGGLVLSALALGTLHPRNVSTCTANGANRVAYVIPIGTAPWACQVSAPYVSTFVVCFFRLA